MFTLVPLLVVPVCVILKLNESTSDLLSHTASIQCETVNTAKELVYDVFRGDDLMFSGVNWKLMFTFKRSSLVLFA